MDPSIFIEGLLKDKSRLENDLDELKTLYQTSLRAERQSADDRLQLTQEKMESETRSSVLSES